MRGWLRRSLWDVAPPVGDDGKHLGRRRAVVVATLVPGVALLAVLLRLEPGSRWFLPVSSALVVVWAGGALLSGPLRLGRLRQPRGDRLVRPVLAPVALGLGLAALFAAGGLVVRLVPWLDDHVHPVVTLVEVSALPLVVLAAVVNGAAEELFFRGAVFAALPGRPEVWTTVVYVLATLATGNPVLTLAAALLGTVVGLERRASGGVLAPLLTHCTWSLAMIVLLPLVFG
ncbi:MAG TPA: type II CAAX endopeptidase family protein [Nocardioides sp.]|nr:type II CAAX endopeptidase family protein [Nocardioides sp.]